MDNMCGYLKHAFNHKLKDLYFMWLHNKTYSRKYKLGKNIEAWASNSSLSFSSSSSPHFSSMLLVCLFSFYFIYNFILHIENFFRLTDLTFKDCNYSLTRNLASETKFYCLIYERSKLLILSDSLTLFWPATVGWFDYGSASN